MDCECCGSALESTRPDGLYYDGDQITCTDCGAVHTVSVDAEEEQVWVQGWICRHGVDDATPCPACEASATPDTGSEGER